MDDDVKVVDLARARSKLDGTVLLSAILASVVIPLVHKILHYKVFTVRIRNKYLLGSKRAHYLCAFVSQSSV